MGKRKLRQDKPTEIRLMPGETDPMSVYIAHQSDEIDLKGTKYLIMQFTMDGGWQVIEEGEFEEDNRA